MNLRKYLLTITVIFIFFVTFTHAHQRVLLKDVSAITLSATGMTTGRRNPPIPQMQCVGGPCKYAPSTVLCSNAGFDGVDVLWKCKADLEKGIKLGDITVNCEGFDYPDDPFILRGSCALEYTLTGQAEVEKQQQQHRYQTGHSHTYHQTPHRPVAEEQSSWSGTIVTWLIIGAIVYFIYKACTQARDGDRGGGGVHRGDSDNPPGGLGASNMSHFSYSNDGGSKTSSSSSSSGPGFWTGAATGGAVGYMLGRRSAAQNQYQQQTRPTVYAQPSAPTWSSSTSSSSPAPSSMGTSSSTAFGGTRRR